MPWASKRELNYALDSGLNHVIWVGEDAQGVVCGGRGRKGLSSAQQGGKENRAPVTHPGVQALLLQTHQQSHVHLPSSS